MDPFFWPSQIFSKSIKLLIFNVLLVKSEHIWQSVDFERKRCQMNRKNDPIWLTMTWRFFKKTMKDSLRSLVGDFWPLSDAAWMMVLFLKSLFQSFNAQFVWNLFSINQVNESLKLYYGKFLRWLYKLFELMVWVGLYLMIFCQLQHKIPSSHVSSLRWSWRSKLYKDRSVIYKK